MNKDLLSKRAESAADNSSADDACEHLYYKLGYEKGAKEQNEIIINAACDWLKKELYTDHNEADKHYPDSVQSASYFTSEELIEDFKKAMEEQE